MFGSPPAAIVAVELSDNGHLPGSKRCRQCDWQCCTPRRPVMTARSATWCHYTVVMTICVGANPDDCEEAGRRTDWCALQCKSVGRPRLASLGQAVRLQRVDELGGLALRQVKREAPVLRLAPLLELFLGETKVPGRGEVNQL